MGWRRNSHERSRSPSLYSSQPSINGWCPLFLCFLGVVKSIVLCLFSHYFGVYNPLSFLFIFSTNFSDMLFSSFSHFSLLCVSFPSIFIFLFSFLYQFCITSLYFTSFSLLFNRLVTLFSLSLFFSFSKWSYLHGRPRSNKD